MENLFKHFPPTDTPVIIFDVGARDCNESIVFYTKFKNARIFSFECNPNTLGLCRKAIEPYKDRITLIERAVCEHDGSILFYPINQEKTITSWKDGNPGASSLFRSNGTYEHEYYVQDEVIVPSTRLDTIMEMHNIEHVDIMWMDLQGAELLALKSLGKYLQNVKCIYTEISHRPIYEGQVMFHDLHSFLSSNGFCLVGEPKYTGWQEDVIYVRR